MSTATTSRVWVRAASLREGVAALIGEVEKWRGAARARDDISILAAGISAAPPGAMPGIEPMSSPPSEKRLN